MTASRNGRADSLGIEALRLEGKALDALARPEIAGNRRPPRHRPGGQFLKGPIPLAWLAAAGRLPHRALHVGILLWFEAGCRKARTVTFCLARGETMGLGMDTARRALRELERAGLVTIQRRPGRGLGVTLNDVCNAAGAGHGSSYA
jgi:hypothetical protein